MAEQMSEYTVQYKKDDTGWWIASIKQVRGCHTQGRTIEQARKRIREALGLFIDDADDCTLIDEIVLPASARTLVRQVISTRKRAEEENLRLQKSTAQAAKVLTKNAGLSVRDVGEILGLSHQRIHQLISANSATQKIK